MPIWGYSIKELDPDRTVKCAGRELRISPKAATEICRTIKGMRLEQAKELLEGVTEGRVPIAYRRYNKEVAHRSQDTRFAAGRYPIRAAKGILRMLEQLESNAEYKGLDVDRLKIMHAASQRGTKTRRSVSRAYGRATPYQNIFTHIELVGYEASE